MPLQRTFETVAANACHRSPSRCYAVALGSTAIALILRWWAEPLLGITAPWIFFFPSVLIASWYGGFRAGVLAGVTSALAAWFFWIKPQGAFFPVSAGGFLSITIFLACCFFISYLSELWHRALRAEAEAKAAAEAKLRESMEALKSSIAELEAFSYTVSHDLRAPLRSINGFADVLLDDYSPSLDDAAKGYLKRMKNAARRMDSLITGVLDYSRINRTDIKLEHVDLEPLVDEIIDQYPQLRQPHVHIEVVKPLQDVRGVRPMLVQCVSNLLTNAVKFIKPGAEARIKIWTKNGDGKVRLFIQDNGIGMDERYTDKIFLPFHRLNDANAFEGTGIGLSIVKKAVERMQGEVGVQSKLDAGTTFWIELPAAAKRVD